MVGMNPAEFANIAKCERDFWWYRGVRTILDRILAPWLEGRQVGRVLEAGCGTGYFSHLLQTERGWPVVPMDLSADGLRYAREMGVNRPVQGDTCSLPFAADAFDIVLSMDVLPHLPQGAEIRAAKEMARVLAPGGLLVIRAAALDVLRSRHSQFAFEKQRFTKRRLTAMAELAGLKIVRCTYTNTLLLPVALAKFRLWEPLLRKPAASGVDPVPGWLDGMLYAALAMEAKYLGTGGGFPVGQSLVMIAEKPR
jgi:SAM-dependent methyltransferase